MSDGLYDGYRMEVEGRDRARRMAVFGTGCCFTCGKLLGSQEKEPVKVGNDRNIFLQFDVVLDGNGRPEPAPTVVRFCTETCRSRLLKAMEMTEGVRNILAKEQETSAAFRENVRRHLERALSGTRRPSV